MINIDNAKIDDCCFFLVPGERKPRFGTIIEIILKESAFQVLDTVNGGYYVVWIGNSAWEESE